MDKETLNAKLRNLYIEGRRSMLPESQSPAIQLDIMRSVSTTCYEFEKECDRPRVGVGVLVFDRAPGEGVTGVLLQLRKGGRYDGLWMPPGGCLEHGETFGQAACRELYEETGLSAEGGRFVHAATNDVGPGPHTSVSIYVVVRNWCPSHPDAVKAGGPVVREPDKAADVKFFKMFELPAPMLQSFGEFITFKVGPSFSYDEIYSRKTIAVVP